MESNTQYLQKRVFVYWERINILLMSNRGFTKTEIKHWVELFFGVKVVAVNSHRLPGKGRRMGPILGHTMHYRRMIITLQPGYSIPLLDRETN
uniref:ribosomal protein L23 n=1 Tax=Themeda japonica TaxID=649504 RepID=UPI0023AAAB32|nr:ribosomal protein L23 [Themeda japonica]WCF70678.1 ribosomal protein L23 [Themeda japonica]